MKKASFLMLALLVLIMTILIRLPEVQAQQVLWADDFDGYPTGANMHGLGGWKGWRNDPTFTAYTTDVQAWNAPNSLDILGNADLLHEFAFDSGVFNFRFYQYIPSNLAGSSYFMMYNQYDDNLVTTNWSVQVRNESISGLIHDDGTGASMPYISNQWVPVCVDINLDQDKQNYYYNNTLLYSGTWSQHISGGGITSLAAFDFFANGASSIYYDGLTLASGACQARGITYYLFLPHIVG